MIDVAIIGGGISGLTAAYELKRKGFEVKVLERQVRAGGNAISENMGGFLMEHGPSTINASMPEVHDLSSSFGLNNSIVHLGEQVKHRYLVKDGKLNGISTRPFGFLTSNYLSLKGRVRLLTEAIISKGPCEVDETVDQYFTRRFGKEFAARIMDPLIGGLYAGHSDELSVKSVFPKLIEMEQKYGSISKAALIRHFQGQVMPARRLYSWKNGIGSLPKALSGALAGNIKLGVTVRKIRACREGFEIDTVRDGKISARSVLIATQPHIAASFLEELSPAGSEAMRDITAPPVAVVFMGYKRSAIDHPLDGLGYLSASRESQILTGAQFPSSMFPRRAPEGHVALTGYLSGTKTPEISRLGEKDLVDLAEKEFKGLLGIRGHCEVSKVRFWPRGIPQYTIGHEARKTRIQQISQEVDGLFTTGNYLSGPSVGACVTNASEAAKKISSFLNANITTELKKTSHGININ